MQATCLCPPEAGNVVCELPAGNFQRKPRAFNACPACGVRGKPVKKQTVKALLSVSLREMREVEYLFCKTQTCPVVYFSQDGDQTFTVGQVREGVFQKQPDNDEVYICYCFRHTVGELRISTPEVRKEIIEDINIGIRTGQCACDLRNPQGSCCLGNVYGLIKLTAK
jgi:hypothetical protein